MAGAIPSTRATIIPNSGCMNTECVEVMIETKQTPEKSYVIPARRPANHPSLCVFQHPHLFYSHRYSSIIARQNQPFAAMTSTRFLGSSRGGAHRFLAEVQIISGLSAFLLSVLRARGSRPERSRSSMKFEKRRPMRIGDNSD